MPCAPLLRFSDFPAADARSEAGQVMSGVLEMVGGRFPGGTQRVFVRVYRTSSEHFCVLYPVRAIATACRPLASINLRNCSVKQLPNCVLRVSPRSCEGMSVTFRGTDTTNESAMGEWSLAFSELQQDGASRKKKVSDHRLPLPVLVESEEDEGGE